MSGITGRRVVPQTVIEESAGVEVIEELRIEVDEEVAPQLEPPYDIQVTVRDGTDAAAISIANDY